ncbi:MAG: O-antigen ligase family protein [Saprospiraceae bacterium]
MYTALKVDESQVVGMPFVYIYFLFVLLLSAHWVYKGEVKHKFEILVLCFYLMTGNLNDLLTFAIPGISFFEIQPDRFLFFMFSFFLIRQFYFSKESFEFKNFWNIPWFIVILTFYALFKIISLSSHSDTIEFPEIIIKSLHVVNVLVIILSLRVLFSPKLIEILGKALLVGAITTCLVSFVQIGIDPLFARTGDVRIAFGSVYRVNGIFNAEYFSSYYLIIATAWVLTNYEDGYKKIGLVSLYFIGIFLTFHRMSWLLIFLVLAIYFLFLAKPQMDKLLLAGMTGITLLLVVFLIFQREIVNSTLVKERVTETVDSRFGYYDMVFDNIGDKPILGYGNHDNEVYYYSMLHITRMRERATGAAGGIHSGYLSAMFYYGIPAFLSFTLFVLSTIIYFARLYIKTVNPIFSIAFVLAFVYGIANITNTLLFSEYLGIFFAIFIGLGLGARYYSMEEEEETTLENEHSQQFSQQLKHVV